MVVTKGVFVASVIKAIISVTGEDSTEPYGTSDYYLKADSEGYS